MRRNGGRRVPRVGVLATLCVAVFVLTVVGGRSDVAGQGRGRGGGPAGPPRPATELAPIDLVGTWVSIVSEDWRWRMVTPAVGDTASIPLSAEGRKVAASWNLEADSASGNQCRAFGVGGIMRQPGRIRISWQDPQTLKLEFDAGTQTRLLHFSPDATPPAEPTWQGFSRARWEGPGVGRGLATGDGRADPRVTGGTVVPDVPGGGGRGLRGAPPPSVGDTTRGGNLTVVTTNFRAGYLRKNGVPYSEQATITERIYRLPAHPNGDEWLHVVTIVEDPRYLSQPFYTSTSFLREANDANFRPTPCETAPPLPRADR